MVSFHCENCGDVLTKKKLDPHRNRCWGATYTCIDCMVHFAGTDYRAHTSCMTEAEKNKSANLNIHQNKKAKTSATTSKNMTTTMARPAYVEEVPEEINWKDYEDHSDDDDDRSPVDLPPEAPTPPSLAEGPVNVFDFLVNGTPSASNLNLPGDGPIQLSEDTQLVRFDSNLLDTMDDLDDDAMVQYGTGPVPTGTAFETPAPKGERKKAKNTDSEIKKDKKRKRLHIETDQIMTDAPPVLHSGLTGGLNKLMTRPHAFPPSPEHSSGDMADTPASPLKKSKHSKHHKPTRTEMIGNSLMAMISGPPAKTKTKTKKRKQVSGSGAAVTKKSHRHRLEAPKEQKLLEYKKDGENGADGQQMILYKPRAEHFLSFITKGPESERGCSLNKALKRYHRERVAMGQTLGKPLEEKELFRSLRLRKNERGEIVLFTV